MMPRVTFPGFAETSRDSDASDRFVHPSTSETIRSEIGSGAALPLLPAAVAANQVSRYPPSYLTFIDPLCLSPVVKSTSLLHH